MRGHPFLFQVQSYSGLGEPFRKVVFRDCGWVMCHMNSRYQCIGLDSDSQSTGSDSMPGNVRMAIDDMITTLEAMKARIDGAHESQ